MQWETLQTAARAPGGTVLIVTVCSRKGAERPPQQPSFSDDDRSEKNLEKLRPPCRCPGKTSYSCEGFSVDYTHMPRLRCKKGRFCLLYPQSAWLCYCRLCGYAGFPLFVTSQPMTRSLSVKLHF